MVQKVLVPSQYYQSVMIHSEYIQNLSTGHLLVADSTNQPRVGKGKVEEEEGGGSNATSEQFVWFWIHSAVHYGRLLQHLIISQLQIRLPLMRSCPSDPEEEEEVFMHVLDSAQERRGLHRGQGSHVSPLMCFDAAGIDELFYELMRRSFQDSSECSLMPTQEQTL
ncbi:hypothetical protein CRENBAI_005584 [Crenichthys baileyi]|uniref:Uncharacterized protein n=1 Tax=Crenichthys baileyi TaxID=28760 RepID=A0AAV9S803_9TELE